MPSNYDKLKRLDHTYLWHPFTQMQGWMGEEPCIIERGDGHYLIDVQGNKYLDGVSSLWCNIRALREGLRKLGFALGKSESQIVPLVIGGAEKCMAFSERLLQKGVFAQGIRPPTVPEGTSRLRITLMATHTHEHLHQALRVFKEVKAEAAR